MFLDETGLGSEFVSETSTYRVDNLKPNTEYTFYIRSYTNSVSDSSEKLSFKTMEEGKKIY